MSKDRFLQRKLKRGEDQRTDRKKQVGAMEDSIIRQINNGVCDLRGAAGEPASQAERWWRWISAETWTGAGETGKKSMW